VVVVMVPGGGGGQGSSGLVEAGHEVRMGRGLLGGACQVSGRGSRGVLLPQQAACDPSRHLACPYATPAMRSANMHPSCCLRR
jgi:hypothetical protein